MSKLKTSEIYRIPPQNYIHILDKNTNVTRVEIGPLNYTCYDNEEVVLGPEPMIIIPPRHYCIIENPCRKKLNEKTNEHEIIFDKVGQVTLRHGEQEVRLHQNPFPLYPGEIISGKVTSLKILMNQEALPLRCLQDFIDSDNVQRRAGEEWLFEGPGQYIPNVNVEERAKIEAKIIRENQALRLIATQDTIDRDGNQRKAGEDWLVTKPGAYLPGVFEQILDMVNCITLTETVSCHLRATANFVDAFGNERKTGDVWLITYKDCETYIPSVNEEKVADIPITILTSREFCVICDPYNESTKTNDFGTFKLQQGEKSFFLHPGETLRKGVEQIYVLTTEEGLILSATLPFDDIVDVSADQDVDDVVLVGQEQKQDEKAKKIRRKPGEKWLIRGPMEYIPPVEAIVVKKVEALSLDKNEGVYIRDIKTGEVRMEVGPQKYMLNEHEELWEKEIPGAIEKLLQVSSYINEEKEGVRDKTKVITYRIPYNSAVQIYDYKEKKPRVVFGPELVMLGPDEMFTPLSLSGGKPKEPNKIRSLHLQLGPDFFTDIIEVETSDHARLSMKLSYNWRFDVARFDDGERPPTALFSVADFVGDACNAIASHVRAAVAACPFDEFHKHSATLIRAAVFGTNEKNEMNYKYEFPANGLLITEVDIQAIEPVDARTRQALQRSVQIAIEITTASQEATAQQEADRQDQEAKGKLERSKIQDQAEAEKIKKLLLELQAQTKAIETSGAAIAEAQSYAEANKITYEAAVDEATLLEEAQNTRFNTELDGETKQRETELNFLKEKYELEANFNETIADIECNKFASMMKAIGPETLKTMALSSDEIQVRLLQGLGLRSTLIMDGRKPLNLFQTASQMIHRIDHTANNDNDNKTNTIDTTNNNINNNDQNNFDVKNQSNANSFRHGKKTTEIKSIPHSKTVKILDENHMNEQESHNLHNNEEDEEQPSENEF